MLIAHEDAFHRSYLEDVLTASGAAVAGAERDAAATVALLEAEPLLDTLVLSPLLPDGQAAVLAGVAVRRGIAILVVEPARGGGGTTLPGDAMLRGPYAGFQVVDAVAALLASRKPLARSTASPHLRRH